MNRVVLESIKIDDFDDYALKAFWRHRQAGHAPGLTHAQVTEILKAVCEMQKKYGITSKCSLLFSSFVRSNRFGSFLRLSM